MRFVLEDAHGDAEIRRALLRKLLPDAAFEFFGAPDSGWDAAIDGTELALPVIPPAEKFGWRGWSNAVAGVAGPAGGWDEDSFQPGSNSWAVPGHHTNGAILANDMHLSLGVPGVWFRARLRYSERGSHDLNGFTLPGTPVLVVGSNRNIAWGFTAAGMDLCDLVELQLDPGNPRRYRTVDGWSEFSRTTEEIAVRGGTNVPLTLDLTEWGPVIDPRGLGKRYALVWAGARSDANNLRLMELEHATDVVTALEVAPFCGIANNNLVVVGRDGSPAWTLTGRLPDRKGFAGDLPVPWTNYDTGWRGLLPLSEYPRFTDLPVVVQGNRLFPNISLHGSWISQPQNTLPSLAQYQLLPENVLTAVDYKRRFWTANGRIVGSRTYLNRIGAGLQDFGARSWQIREDVCSLTNPSERDLWEIYRDDRALYLDSWQRRLVATLERGAATNAEWQEALGFVKNWGGRAAADSVGYRLVAGFHRSVDALAFEPLVKAGRALNPDFRYRNNTVLEMLVNEQPAHLLNPRFQSYDELFAAAAEQIFASLREQKVPLAEATWGRRNLLNLQHPLARAIPALSGLLNLPRVAMNGAPNDLPKIQGSDFGPSERMVVSPGHEERGLCNQPAGQSGHFLSPFYRAGHEAWVKVEPLPFLPGPPRHRLDLKPAA
jgi:penicillin amidase